jgi:hypothetical protein
MDNFNLPQSPLNVKVNINDLKTVLCDCGGQYFDRVYMYKVIPAVYTPLGKVQLLAVQCIRCVKCGAVRTEEDVLKGVS